MTFTQILLIFIIIIPIIAVIFLHLRMDLAALIIAASLGIMQLLGLQMLGPAHTPDAAIKTISGFSQPVVITLISLFILTRGLEKAGVTRWIARKLIAIGGISESRLIALFAATTALLSLFMNNLAAGALVLPSAMEASRRTGIRPSKLLIPVAYGSLLGGTATYFTTANIVVSDLLQIAHPPQSPLNFLAFTPTGGLIAIAGIIFLALLGKKELPNRAPAAEQMMTRLTSSELEDYYQLNERLWEAKVLPTSSLVGKTLAESCIGQNLGIVVTAIWKGKEACFAPPPEQMIEADDYLLLVGREDKIRQLNEQDLLIGHELSSKYISSRGVVLVEILLAPHSSALEHTLKELNFRRHFGLTAVALHRRDRSYRTDIGDMKLQLGDSLLVIGTPQRIRNLQQNLDFIVLEPSLSDQPVNRKQAIFSVSFMLAAIIASILGVPVYLAMMIGALLIVIGQVLTMDEAYKSISWQAIFLIAGMYTVSVAMIETGLANLLGSTLLNFVTPLGPLGLAGGSYLLSALLTQLMGGQVTAMVTGPITISAAINMGVNPQAIAVATAIGCSASFFTPLAHPVNILMIAPANYTFGDFFRIGWKLTLLSFVMLLVGMILFWGL